MKTIRIILLVLVAAFVISCGKDNENEVTPIDKNTDSSTGDQPFGCEEYKIKRMYDYSIGQREVQYVSCDGISKTYYRVGGDGGYTTLRALSGSVRCNDCIWEEGKD